MGALILGAIALLVILLLLRLFAGVDPKLLARSLRYFGAGVLLLAAIGLAAFDRVGLAMLAGSFAWGLFTGGRLPSFHWPYGFPQSGPRSRPRGPTGAATDVRTEWVEMTLNHDTGAMSGRVLKGAYANRALDALGEDDAIELYLEAGRGDAETANLLSAYLDRRFGADWHAKAEHAAKRNAHGRPDSGMSRAEAFAILGLRPGASDDDIRAAHRKLMLKNHPDLGGSGEDAAKINEAKDVLLHG